MPNRDRIGAALEVMKLALRPYVEKQLHIAYGEHWVTSSLSALPKRQESISRPDQWDIHLILAIIWNNWNGVFSSRLGRMERTFISELQEVRNRWAHQGQFDDEDTFRALGTMEKLLRAVSAKEVTDIQRLKTEAMQFLSKNLDNSVRISRVNEVPTGEPSSYHVYINTRNPPGVAMIHFSNCSFANQGKGIAGKPPNPKSYWSDRLHAYNAATDFAQKRHPRINVRPCQFCNPQK